MAGEHVRVWSAERVSRLRAVLWAVLALAVLLAVTAAHAGIALVPDDRGLLPFTVVLAAAAATVLGCSLLALRALPGAGRDARRWVLGTGVLLLVLALPLSGLWVGLLLPVLGIGLLAMALPRDEAEA